MNSQNPSGSRFLELSPEALAARKRRNVYIAIGLVAFMTLLFTTTFLRMMSNQKAARAAHAAEAAGAPATVISTPGQMSSPSTISGQ
ncbi:hypothetical protein BH10PSE2_BH10PSE2_13280 [soil metagenome]